MRAERKKIMKVSDVIDFYWVEWNGEYVKVVGTVFGHDKLIVENYKGDQYTVDPNDVSPIKLTKDFLEKHCDESYPGDSYQMRYEFDSVCVSYYELGDTCGLEYCEEDTEFEYLHQLQRLLKSCNVDKEFKLWDNQK